MICVHKRNMSNLLDLFNFFNLFVRTKISSLNKSMDANCIDCSVCSDIRVLYLMY